MAKALIKKRKTHQGYNYPIDSDYWTIINMFQAVGTQFATWHIFDYLHHGECLAVNHGKDYTAGGNYFQMLFDEEGALTEACIFDEEGDNGFEKDPEEVARRVTSYP